MNYFGINLTGKKAVYKAKQFYKAGASVEARTLVCESGPGCFATKADSVGQFMKPYGYATIVARFSDGACEAVDSYALEAYINRAGNLVPREDEFTEEPAMVEVEPSLLTPNGVTPTGGSKPRGRIAWKSMDEETVPVKPVATVPLPAKPEIVQPIGHAHPAPAPATPVNGTLATAAEAGLDFKAKDAAVEPWSEARAVALYQGGMKVSDIAAHFGDRNKQNRVRKACKDAGVYQGK